MGIHPRQAIIDSASGVGNRNPTMTMLLTWIRRPMVTVPSLGIGVAVLGVQHGDEGKGATVAFLIEVCGIKLTVRFQGGGNAGHEFEILCADGEWRKVSVHHLPEGALFDGISAIAEGCLIHRWKFVTEVEELEKLGFQFGPNNLLIDPHVVVATAYEFKAGNINDSGASYTGSTRTLIREMSMARVGKYAITVYDIVNDYDNYALLRRKLKRCRAAYARTDWVNEIDFEHEIKDLIEFGNFLKARADITDVRNFVLDWQGRGLDFIFVGGQGAQLGSRNAPFGSSTPMWPPLGFPQLPNIMKIGCMKLLPTCSGPHMVPTYLPDTEALVALRKARGDFGKTTGRKYHYYQLWIDAIAETQRRFGLDMVLFRKADLDFGPITVRTGLEIDGVPCTWYNSELELWDGNAHDVDRHCIVSSRVTVPGRVVLPAIEGPIAGVRAWEDLPAGLRERVETLDRLLAEAGIPEHMELRIGAIGNGPAPRDMVIRPRAAKTQ